MTPFLAVVLALTVHRLTRLVVADTITEPIRRRILTRWPSDDTVFTGDAVTHTSGEPQTEAGAVLFQVDRDQYAAVNPHWLGTLITCPWCVSVWVAALTVPVFWLWPDVMLWVGMVPAASSVTGLLSSD